MLGVDTTLLAMLILLLAVSWELLRYPRYPIGEMFPFFAFALVVLFGVTMSGRGEYQDLKARDFFFIASVIAVSIPVLIRGVGDLRGLVFMWLLAGSIAAGTVQVVGGSESLLELGRTGIGDATLGPAYLASAGLVIGAVGWAEGLIRWFVAMPAVGLAGLAVVGIGSRGPLLAAFVGVTAWILLSGVFRRRSVRASLALGAAILLGMEVASEASVSRLFLYHDIARAELWATAWQAFLEHPVLGLGWGDFSTVAWAPYPHNLFLEVAVELGVLGIFAFGALLLAGGLRTWARSHSYREVRVLAAVAIVALVGQLFSSDLTNRSLWIALIPSLLFARICRGRRRLPSAQTPIAPRAR